MTTRARLLGWLVLAISLIALAACTATRSTTGEPGAVAAIKEATAEHGVTRLVAIITAIGALGGAAFSLVDATKAFWGGVSNVGLPGLLRAMARFSAALDGALGPAEQGQAEWRRVVRAHWINGRPRGEQKAIVKSLIRLGLTPDTAGELARAGNVAPDALRTAAEKLQKGSVLTDTDLNVLGRLDASVEAQLDAAFDHADQLYRNVTRFFAGVLAVALAYLATWALGWNQWALALVVGLLAVPLAPIAKDLASSLQAAAAALRSAR
jgi:hypothetical protein